jgi:glutamine amidotransferase
MTAAIIDYGMGNVASVEKALTFLGISSKVTRNYEEIDNAEYLILPGVGAFNQGMDNLVNYGLVNFLNEQVIVKKKPIMGICLGMQLIAEKGYEPNECKGLGWVKGEVVRIQEPGRSVPHLGWNEVTVKDNSIMSEFDNKDFYFIHSFHFDVEEHQNILARVNYGNNYVAAIQKENICGFQFHPEKSQTAGLALMKKFFEFYA